MGVDVKVGLPIREDLTNIEVAPDWFDNYLQRLNVEGRDLLEEVKLLSTFDVKRLEERLGGPVNEIPYETLMTLFVEGSDDPLVAEVLRNKRAVYLKSHPEEYKGAIGAGMGVITYDGRFISQKDWQTTTDSEKRAILVGSTCFHYNIDTPGMGSDSKDRF